MAGGNRDLAGRCGSGTYKGGYVEAGIGRCGGSLVFDNWQVNDEGRGGERKWELDLFSI